jgi:hypothetical protein
MRKYIESSLAQTIAWMWLGFLVAGVVAWPAYRYWRQRHPLPAPAPERSYSQRLAQRLAKRQGAAKRKRRDGSAKSHPHRQ